MNENQLCGPLPAVPSAPPPAALQASVTVSLFLGRGAPRSRGCPVLALCLRLMALRLALALVQRCQEGAGPTRGRAEASAHGRDTSRMLLTQGQQRGHTHRLS